MEIKELLTPPVIWFLVGLILLLLELAVPGLVIFFFGVGAWIVALCLLLFDMSLTAQLLVFGITSIIGLLLLRKILRKKFFKEDDSNEGSLEEEFIGKIAIAETKLAAGIPGKVSFKGTQWNAIADVDIEKGAQVKVTGKDSITLKVTAI
jgi:membrane protein implicated in regulation of membrane protease activity